MLFDSPLRRKYKSLKKKHEELKKQHKKLLDWYHRLYALHEECEMGVVRSSVLNNLIKKRISQNSSNIRNFNLKDRKYLTRRYVCLDGQKVRSKVEREIYNYLILNGVKVRYEAIYRTPWGSVIRPDFYLPEFKVYIEYFGKEEGEDEKYDEIMRFKKELYSLSTTPFVILEHGDEEDLYKNLKIKISPFMDTSDWI